MTAATSVTYRFGPFELRPAEYTLTRDGAPVRVTPKAFDALCLLVANHGRVVPKDTLIASLWPDSIVEDANLTVQLAAVRKALGGSRGSNDYIETVSKRGYRFIPHVERLEEDARAEPEASASIAVVPFKILKGHPDVDFVAFSLPDAIAASLADRSGVVVRSPIAAQRHGGADADLPALAAAMQARFALTGTVTYSGGRISVRVQLLEPSAGTVLWSESRTASLQDLFALQDEIVGEVVRSLTAHMPGSRAASLQSDIPKSAGAYAFYLRANQLAYEASRWTEARDLYRACLDLDPDYAPAWARLGRCERLIGKFSDSIDDVPRRLATADEAFRRALAINPDLSVAHSLSAQLMIDVGRADEAMAKLLERVRKRPSDPELFAGLVHALRYCGLLHWSVLAHERARRLDSAIPTSVHHTWWMMGEFGRALAETFGDIGYMQGLALASLGRDQEAIAALRWRERETIEGRIRPYLASLRALLEGDREKAFAALEAASALQIDAEALFYLARSFARLGALDRAAVELGRVIDGGFWCYEGLCRDPWLESLRERTDVQSLLERARANAERAEAVFGRAGGPRLIG